jgi:hypothetical protein
MRRERRDWVYVAPNSPVAGPCKEGDKLLGLMECVASLMNIDNSIEGEVQYRLTLGNKAYYTNQFLFKIRLVSKKSKLKLYWNTIRPIVTYAYETWALKETN